MRLRFPESQIETWAQRYSVPPEEDKLMDWKESVQTVGCLSKAQLRELVRWKSPRNVSRVEKNTDGFIKEITSFTLRSPDERAQIEALTLLDGVAWPTASVVLHLYHRDRYPILDFRAIWSVQEKVPSQYQFPFWQTYVGFCKALADKRKVSMRVLDRALWQYSKENQGAA